MFTSKLLQKVIAKSYSDSFVKMGQTLFQSEGKVYFKVGQLFHIRQTYFKVGQ